MKKEVNLNFILVLLLLFIAFSFIQSPIVIGQSIQRIRIKVVISETLVSIDDPDFKPYNSSSGTGLIARVVDVDGIKYFQSLINGDADPPPDDYIFRYLTKLPEIDATKHWKIYFRHKIVNLADVDLVNCILDGWHSYLIAPGGSLYGNIWRLYKYNSSSPTVLKAKSTITANTSYIIHNIPSGYRVTFIFSFKTGDTVLDSWVENGVGVIGREIIKFKGLTYVLPLMELNRVNPGTVKLTQPKLIEYNFKVTNLNDTSSLQLRLEYKFGETTVWEMQLWPSGYQGKVGALEFKLKPLETKSLNMSLLYPEDKDDHAVLVYFSVLIISGEEAPPLKGEIWENLYGVNSYLGIKESWINVIINIKEDSKIDLFTVVAPYVSPFSQDILPYEHYLEVRVFDSNYEKLVYGPIKIVINGTIKKGDELLINYTIPLKELGYKSGRYIIQIDTYRKGLIKDMNLGRTSFSFHLSFPNIKISNLRLENKPKIGEPNKIIVTVENSGEAPAKNFKVGLYENNKIIEEKIISLRPGEIINLTFNFTPQTRESKLIVKADIDRVLLEEDLNDNQASKLLTSPWFIISPYILIALITIAIVGFIIFYERIKRIKRKNK
ncbi:MAG: CARDB domain-containing protein [Candidatus Bathyarchaeia archaeon]